MSVQPRQQLGLPAVPYTALQSLGSSPRFACELIVMSKDSAKDVHISINPGAPIPAKLVAQALSLTQRSEKDIDYSDIAPTPRGVVWTKPGRKLPDTK